MTFQKGDVLIEYGQAYTVLEIKEKRDFNGKSEEYLYYQPLFNTNRHSSTRHSIPVKSLPLTNKRKPVSLERITKILEELATQKEVFKSPVNLKDAEATFKTNKLSPVVVLLKSLKAENLAREDNLTAAKQGLFDQGVEFLSQEVAVVLCITLEEAREQILASLG